MANGQARRPIRSRPAPRAVPRPAGPGGHQVEFRNTRLHRRRTCATPSSSGWRAESVARRARAQPRRGEARRSSTPTTRASTRSRTRSACTTASTRPSSRPPTGSSARCSTRCPADAALWSPPTTARCTSVPRRGSRSATLDDLRRVRSGDGAVPLPPRARRARPPSSLGRGAGDVRRRTRGCSPATELLDEGWLGPDPSPATRRRVGDVVLAARDGGRLRRPDAAPRDRPRLGPRLAHGRPRCWSRSSRPRLTGSALTAALDRGNVVRITRV